MKAIVGGAIGAAALGGALLLANTRTTTSPTPATTVASASLAQMGPLSVDCGVGRIALIKPVAPGQSYSQVECAPAPAAFGEQAFAQPQAGYLVQATYPTQPAVQERVVYRDRPVARTSARRSVTYAPARTEVKQGRSWKKSALIIGGSAAGGAGVGALLGGGSGAKKGAVVGGIGGLVYDLATRNK